MREPRNERSEALRHSTTRVCTKVLRHTDLLQGFRVPEPQGPTGTEPVLYLHLPYLVTTCYTQHTAGAERTGYIPGTVNKISTVPRVYSCTSTPPPANPLPPSWCATYSQSPVTTCCDARESGSRPMAPRLYIDQCIASFPVPREVILVAHSAHRRVRAHARTQLPRFVRG